MVFKEGPLYTGMDTTWEKYFYFLFDLQLWGKNLMQKLRVVKWWTNSRWLNFLLKTTETKDENIIQWLRTEGLLLGRESTENLTPELIKI